MSDRTKQTLYCSFCGKSQHEVRKLIAGPVVFICNECVVLCMDIVTEEEPMTCQPISSLVPEPVLKLLEHVPVASSLELLKEGGLGPPDNDKPYSAREVLEAVLVGVEYARVRVDMTPERVAAIAALAEEHRRLTTAQQMIGRGIPPIMLRIEALRRGEPLEGVAEVIEHPAPGLPGPVEGLDTAVVSHTEERA